MTAKLHGLDGLRGVAALMVFLYHCPWSINHLPPGDMPVSGRFFDGFDSGVGLFFALSAYLLSRPFWQQIVSQETPRGFERFALRRCARILPAYWIAVIITLFPDPRTWTLWGQVNLFAHVSGLQTHLEVNHLWLINNVLWTVSIEIQFYAILATCFWLASRFRSLRVSSGLPLSLFFVLVFMGAGPLYQQAVTNLGPHLPTTVWGDGAPSAAVRSWSIAYFLKWFLPSILVSWFEVLWMERGKSMGSVRTTNALFLLVMIASATFVLIPAEGEWRQVALVGWPLGAFTFALLLPLVHRSTLAHWMLENPIARFFGTISFGLYLWHYPILKAIGKGRLADMPPGFARLIIGSAVGLGATIGVAWISYVLIERPAMAAARQHATFGRLITAVRETFFTMRSKLPA